MIAAMDRAKSLGMATMTLEVRATNERAHRLYISLGFKVVRTDGPKLVMNLDLT